MNPRLPGIYIQIGDTYARLHQWQNAKIAYEKAVALDEDNARAFQGLSTVYRRIGDNQQTVDSALRAVEAAAPFAAGAFQPRRRARALG